MTRHHHGSNKSSRSNAVRTATIACSTRAGAGFAGDEGHLRKIALVYPSTTGHAIVHALGAVHPRFEPSEEAQNVWTNRGWEPSPADRRPGDAP